MITARGATMAGMTLRKRTRTHRRADREDRVPMHFKRRSDKGFSMMEMLGAIAIAGIIAGAAIITIPRFLNRATNSQATAALNTAAAEALELYSRPLPGGDTNFANTPVGSLTSGALTAAAVDKLNDAQSNLHYRDMATTTGLTGDGMPDNALMTTGGLMATGFGTATGEKKDAADEIQKMNDNDVWVAVAGAETWSTGTGTPTGTGDLRAGQAIRMGTASSNGDTFCVILVADTSTGNNIGRGFMSVTESDSEADSGGWADCGLLSTLADREGCAPGKLYSSAQEPSTRAAAVEGSPVPAGTC